MTRPRPVPALPGSACSGYSVHGYRLTMGTPGEATLVRANPFPSGHTLRARVDAFLDTIDGGDPAARAARLADEEFHRRIDAMCARQGEAHMFLSGHFEPTPGVARVFIPEHHYCDGLCLALDPGDRWPGEPTRRPLLRVGYWYGTAARHVFLGEDPAVADEPGRAIARQVVAEIRRCQAAGCRFTPVGYVVGPEAHARELVARMRDQA